MQIALSGEITGMMLIATNASLNYFTWKSDKDTPPPWDAYKYNLLNMLRPGDWHQSQRNA